MEVARQIKIHRVVLVQVRYSYINSIHSTTTALWQTPRYGNGDCTDVTLRMVFGMVRPFVSDHIAL